MVARQGPIAGSYLPATQFPILKYIPDRWLSSKKFAKMAYSLNTATFARAREIVEDRRKNGDFRNSLIDSVLDGAVEPDVPLTYSQINNSLLGKLYVYVVDVKQILTSYPPM
jgi:hypothetical protein